MDTPSGTDDESRDERPPVWRTGSPSDRLDAAPEPPRETTVAAAQSAVNFVAFELAWLPDDCRVDRVTLRPERPPGRPDGVTADEIDQTPHSDGNPCSLRVVVDGDDRRLRVKQFAYDWAPPAAGVAPLWRTDTPEPFHCGDAVGFLGTDYKGNRGAVTNRVRTQLEISVVDGSFADAELERLLSAATPVAHPVADRVRRVPFHRLSYWHRYGCRPPAVPHGLWDHAPSRPYDASQRVSRVGLGTLGDGSGWTDAAATESIPRPLVPTTELYRFDSAVAFPAHDAVECVYRHRANGSDPLWLITAAPSSPLAPPTDPVPADQAAETRETLALDGRTVHYAALSEQFGGWEAVWREAGTHYAVYAGPSRELTGTSFCEVVASLTRA